MAHEVIKIGAVSGLVVTMAGVAMQIMPMPQAQSIGYTATLLGIATTCMAGGFGLASDAWKQFRKEVHTGVAIGDLEAEVGQGLPTDASYIERHTQLAVRASEVFEMASDEKRKDIFYRLKKVGFELSRHMPNHELAMGAQNIVDATMATLRIDLGMAGAFAQAPALEELSVFHNAFRLRDDTVAMQ